ncbi:MAG TPA: hypothetical protein VFI25_02780 [Planctomycetota bacterium]|jgi:uncharacterized protein YndB with AHSA1/START domain|nr:hypothetical protein [Planctomycetota bacterium]
MARKRPAAEERFAGVGDAAVAKRTGKKWKEWFAILDKAGARKWPHKETAAFLYEKQGVSGWWSQMVTVGYEQGRGLRKVNQSLDGFQVSGSRTVGVPIAKLYRAFDDPKIRARWLPEAIAVRKATKEKTMRITWGDGETSVEAYFLGKGPGKSMVNLQHRKLAGAREVAKMRAFWTGRLDRLQAILER